MCPPIYRTFQTTPANSVLSIKLGIVPEYAIGVLWPTIASQIFFDAKVLHEGAIEDPIKEWKVPLPGSQLLRKCILESSPFVSIPPDISPY